jgi:hypothetical protein
VAHDVESHASESNDEPPELGDDDSDPPPLASDSDDEPPKVPPSDNKKEDFKSGFSFARPDLAAISKPSKIPSLQEVLVTKMPLACSICIHLCSLKLEQLHFDHDISVRE